MGERQMGAKGKGQTAKGRVKKYGLSK